LNRLGAASIAAGVVALTIIVTVCAWMVRGTEPADAGLRARSLSVSVFGTIHPKLISYGAPALATDTADAPRARLAREPSFDERFAVASSNPPSRSLQPALSFDARFTGAITSVSPPVVAAVSATVPRASAPRVAAAAPSPRAAPSTVAQAAPKQAGSYRLASLESNVLPPAYASVESPAKDSSINDLLKRLSTRDSTPRDAATSDAATPDAAPAGPDLTHTAIYDISARVVYMPDGRRLEAHSGLGEHLDDVRFISLKHEGPTPPNVYQLSLRENLFHGVRAIRLTPVDGSRMYGRDGMLAHTYMLGPNGQSNGCVSFNDYPAFLNAYLRGDVTRLVVVEHLDDVPGGPRTAGDWFSNTLKGIFGRS
jgi:hypothetical protein